MNKVNIFFILAVSIFFIIMFSYNDVGSKTDTQLTKIDDTFEFKPEGTVVFNSNWIDNIDTHKIISETLLQSRVITRGSVELLTTWDVYYDNIKKNIKTVDSLIQKKKRNKTKLSF